MENVGFRCVGQAASMGSLLLAAGEAGMRHSLPNSRIMIHQPSGGAQVSKMINVLLKQNGQKELNLSKLVFSFRDKLLTFKSKPKKSSE